MNFEEHASKVLLRIVGIRLPKGDLAHTPDEAAAIVGAVGAAVIKAQVPSGKRGKAGGIALVESPEDAREAAQRILGMEIGGHLVEKVLVETQVPIATEYYAAVLNDAGSKGPMLLFSSQGGMDVEDITRKHADKLMRLPVDVLGGFDAQSTLEALPPVNAANTTAIVDVLARLYEAYLANDAELLEVNPLVLTRDDELVAVDCKFVLDDSSLGRRQELARQGTPEKLTSLEQKARDAGLKYIELDGDVGILANGAGLTMTSMDAVSHFGGRAANFLEIGGDAYTLGRQALEIVTANPRVKSLLVNFCGAFARCDVMTAGIVEAWGQVRPQIPVFFTIHGTGEDEAVAMVRDQLGLETFDNMDDAVKAAVEAAR